MCQEGTSPAAAAQPGEDPLPALREQFPGFRIWREATVSRTYYNARRRDPSLSPHTLVTSDPGELRAILTDATT